MKIVSIAGTLLFSLSVSGCIQIPAEPTPPPTTISSYGPLGGFTMSSGANCAGHATLSNGSATVQDPCFSSSENVVVCTDTTSPAAVSCTPGSGRLSIAGIGDDRIAYARVK